MTACTTSSYTHIDPPLVSCRYIFNDITNTVVSGLLLVSYFVRFNHPSLFEKWPLILSLTNILTIYVSNDTICQPRLVLLNQ